VQPTVCILAGGRGTRLGEAVRETPKPVLEVAGEPFLFHVLRALGAAGFVDVVMSVGYLGDVIEEVVGRERFGVRVRYVDDGPQLRGTAGAIRRCLPLLGPEFLVLYGDTFLQVDYGGVARALRESPLPAVMTVMHNDGRWDRSNALVQDGMVVRYDKHAPTPDMTWIDYGLSGYRAEVFGPASAGEADLAAIQGRLAEQRLLEAFLVSERFYEIGTPSALAETEAFLSARGGV